MIQLVFLTTLVSVASTGCPSMCDCTDSSVVCVEKGLDYVPNFESLTNNPTIVDLSGNKIHYISNLDFSFDKSNEVKEIYLNNSEIIDIEKAAFEETENLQELYLGQNLLNNIPEFLIERLDNMILLDISNNYFSGEMPKIRSKTLEVLAVANSKITSVPDDALKYLPNLKLLLLQQNNIKSLSPGVFRNIQQNFFFVRLSYNTWECNCNNTELFQFLASRNFIETSEPYQCIKQNKFVDIFDRNGKIANVEDKCKKTNIVTRQLDQDISDFKEAKAIIDEALELDATEDLEDEAGREICEEPIGPDVAFDFSPRLVLALFISFVLGFVVGVSVLYTGLVMRRGNLGASDSATRLIAT